VFNAPCPRLGSGQDGTRKRAPRSRGWAQAKNWVDRAKIGKHKCLHKASKFCQAQTLVAEHHAFSGNEMPKNGVECDFSHFVAGTNLIAMLQCSLHPATKHALSARGHRRALQAMV
jgi:hypothetical protein